MNKLEDSVIKYQINFERYKNGQANEVIDLLDKANSKIARYIKQTDGVNTKARYKEIASKLRDVSKALKDDVDGNMDIDGVIDYELKKEKKMLELAKPYVQKVKGETVNFLYPTREQIKTAALFQPITTDGYGMTYQSYLEGIEAGLFSTWDSAVRTGYLTGMNTKQIVRNVLGSSSKVGQLIEAGTIKPLRDSIYSNTRTALQSFANETMQRVYEANDDIFGDITPDGFEYKYEYLATLDNRTCLVCADSAHLYKELKDVPHIPQHRGCRCVVIPYFNIEGDTKASKNGQIDANLSFENWLKAQDEKTQIDVLGKTRYKLFQEGASIKQFIDNGEVLTLAQLEEKGMFDKLASIENDTVQEVFDYSKDKPIDKEARLGIAKELGRFGKTVRFGFDGEIYECDAQALKEVTDEFEKLKKQFPTKKLEEVLISDKLDKGEYAESSYKSFYMSKSIAKMLENAVNTPEKWKAYLDKQISDCEATLALEKKKLSKLVEGTTEYLKKDSEIFEIEKDIRFYKNQKNYEVYCRDKNIKQIVAHEYGHILCDQKTGYINGKNANRLFVEKDGNKLYEKCKLINQTFDTADKTHDIYKISYYASKLTDSKVKGMFYSEFFAECFAIYAEGDKGSLPDYIISMIEEVIK